MISYELLAQFQSNPKNVRFKDLVRVCEYYFGEGRQKGSHLIFKTPWAGDPRVNIQDKNGMAKPYQVRQVLDAIQKL
ncbi:toxin HicA [Spirulina subsalsa]|uniref:toxin HicA n=1 Tax=Spirulina subsalsa TaxID=54311 RepID=UPI0038B344D5